MSATSTTSGTSVLELRDIVKEYEGNRVLKGVSLSVKGGEVHALVGENGAGKSTLMNILFGMPVIHETGGYGGTVHLGGAPVRFTNPAQAMEAGLGMVHQEFMLLPGFRVAENIKLNREPSKPNPISRVLGRRLELLDTATMRRDGRRALDTVGLDIDEWLPVAGLPVGHMQFIEIAREVDKEQLKLIIFDEPTAVLTETEAERLLDSMRAFAARGVAVLFITHRLDEVKAVADSVTVLRDGEVAGRLDPKTTSILRIAELMVGRPAGAAAGRRGTDLGSEVALSVDRLNVRMPGEPVEDVSIEVRRGEILGIGGLAGHGKLGIANGIMGLYPGTGAVKLLGEPLPLNDPRGALERGLAFVSEDRRGVGLLGEESIELNIALSALEAHGRFLHPFPIPAFRSLDGKGMRAHAREMIQRLDVRTTGPEQQARRLSGGNQQKVCLARAMALRPRVLFVNEPTRGIDIGAKERVLQILVSLNREEGVTVIVTSSELAELRSLCDRIVLVYRGRVSAVLEPDAPDASFGLAMAGGEVAAAALKGDAT
ncbi:MAG TPA: sugar ABC transporter ATP-binding protein [Candidatus Eisenbacteria bacterium]|nr:sugar ABC transporter ATP-binding protein [Candidatus Eisenbacteria bacterium]